MVAWNGLDHIEYNVKQSEGSSYTRARMLVAVGLAIKKNKKQPSVGEHRILSLDIWPALTIGSVIGYSCV